MPSPPLRSLRCPPLIAKVKITTLRDGQVLSLFFFVFRFVLVLLCLFVCGLLHFVSAVYLVREGIVFGNLGINSLKKRKQKQRST